MAKQAQRLNTLLMVGLAVVLIVLSGTTLWGVHTTQDATYQVIVADREHESYQQLRYLIAAEIATQHEYALQYSTKNQSPLGQTASAIQVVLNTLLQEGEDTDLPRAHQILLLQQQLMAATAQFFHSTDQGDRVEATKTNKQIEALTTRMEQILGTAMQLEQQRRTQQVASLGQTEQTARSTAIVILIIGLVLVLAASIALHSYQSRIAATARAERRRLEQAARVDHLTSLGNHRAFVEELARVTARSRRHDEVYSLALIDIDDFKLINDQHGHSHGDHILHTLGSLLGAVRTEDYAFRLGGDEFAMLLPLTTEQGAVTCLERLRAAVMEHLHGATVSIGITTTKPGCGAIDEAILREQADAALYEAKRRGRNTVATFSEIQHTAAIISATAIMAVRRLLAEQGVSVVFQPIWDLDRETMLGYEALMRPAPEYGLAGPQEAFDIAERIGRAHELDAVCHTATLARAHELPAGALLFINLSPYTLDHDGKAAITLAEAARSAGLKPEQIVLEITERSLARSGVVSREAQRLRELGFRIALDDVGAGNAGLEMLRHVPVDYLKIDREVVAGALHNAAARSVLMAILAFAREAKIFVIAEGVETDIMLDQVIRAGSTPSGRTVRGVQGYFIGRPNAVITPIAVTYPLQSTEQPIAV